MSVKLQLNQLVHAKPLIAVLAATVWIPFIAALVQEDTAYSKLEDRRRASLPPIPASAGELFDLPQQFQDYYADHLGFRDALVRMQRQLLFTLFGQIRADGAYLGKERWIFVHTRNEYTQHAAGALPFAPDELDAWVKFLRDTARKLEEQGIRFLVVLIPNKYSVYPEKLPNWVPYTDEGLRSISLYEALENDEILKVIDLREPLREAKAWSQLYSHADLHWNSRGAYIGYREIVESLKEWFPQLSPAELDRFALYEEELDAPDLFRPVAGLARLTALPELFPMTWYGVRPKEVRAYEVPSPYVRPSVASLGVLNSAVYETGDPARPNMLLFGDSFRWTMIPFLSEHFARSTYLDARVSLLGEEFIEREEPDVVIFATHSLMYIHSPKPQKVIEVRAAPYTIVDDGATPATSP